MKPPFCHFAGLVLLVSAPSLAAQNQPAPDAATAQILEEIASLQAALDGGAASNNERALSTIMTALASAKATYDLYMDSRKQLEFEEQGKRESDWREWRDANEERLRSQEHIEALRFQLRYLALTIAAAEAQRVEGAEREARRTKLVSEVVRFLDDLTAGAEDLAEHSRLLSGSVLGSPISKRLKLDLTLGQVAGWNMSPWNVADTYERTLLPYYRDVGQVAGLSACWDRRIAHEHKLASLPDGGGIRFRRGMSERDREREERREEDRTQAVAEEEFRTDRLPELKWGKLRDTLLFGGERIATLRAMTALVRENLAHERASDWLKEVADLAKKPSYDGKAYLSTVEAGEKSAKFDELLDDLVDRD